MEYNFDYKQNKLQIRGVKNFDLKHIFECGQCFRWKREEDGSYTGVAFNRVVNVFQDGNDVEIRNTNIQDFKDIWFSYFDLGRDYDEVKSNIAKDDIMKQAIEFGSGIRLLRQDFPEVFISYIISANNRIPRISKSIEILSEKFGRKLIWNNKIYYTFPSLEKLSNASLEDIAESKAGFRCKYIKQGASDARQYDVLGCIQQYKTSDARDELMEIKGIGPKIADCILLFTGTKYNVFPTDVWIKRVMEELYFKREASIKEIQEFVRDYFGEYAGFAQQYLFYYARENKIGVSQS